MPSQAATDRTLRAVLRYVVDPRGVRDVKKSSEDLQDQLSDLRSKFFDLMEPIQDMGMLASQFEAIGFEVQDYGRRVTETFSQFAEEYVDAAEGADEVSKEWLQTTEKLSKSQERFGGVAAKSMLPLLKLQSEIVETASKFLEKYPEIAQIAFGIGTAVVLASSLSNAVAKGIRMVADIKLIALEAQRILAAKMMRDAANKQMAAAILASKHPGGAAGAMTDSLRGKFMERGSLLGKAKGAAGGLLGKAGGVLGGVSMASVAAIVASAAAIVATGIAIKKFTDNLEKGHKKVESSWTMFFERTAEGSDSAVEVLDKYREKQDEVSEAHDKAGVLADLFVNKQRIMNVNLGELNQALVKGSRSYEDYEQAVTRFNNEIEDGERPIRRTSEEQYNYRRELEKTRAELKDGQASLKQYARLLVEQGNIIEKIVGTTLYAMGEIQEGRALEGLLDDWLEYQDRLQAAQDTLNEESLAAQEDYDAESLLLETETEEERLRIQNEYDMAVLKMDLDTATERERVLERMGASLTATEESIGQDRERAMQDYADEMSEAEESYYKDRAEAAADYGLDVQRAEQDHQIQMRRMREDSELRQVEAIRSRDAMALIEERRSYETDRRRSEEDYAIEAGRRSQDFARQMAQMEQSFKEQQAAREKAHREALAELQKSLAAQKALEEQAAEEQLEALEEANTVEGRALYDSKEQQLKDLEESNEDQEGELKKSYDTRISDAKNAHRREINDARGAWDKRRQEAGVWNDKELRQYRRFREDALGELRRFVRDANMELRGLQSQGSTFQGFNAGGGYANTYGTYRMAEQGKEFTLSNPTTTAAEKLLGGRLTQESLLRGLGSGSGTPQVKNEFTFYGRLSDSEKGEYKRIAYEQSLRALGDVMKGVN